MKHTQIPQRLFLIFKWLLFIPILGLTFLYVVTIMPFLWILIGEKSYNFIFEMNDKWYQIY
jgi:hypothetical protein